jgi:hypothetical protein
MKEKRKEAEGKESLYGEQTEKVKKKKRRNAMWISCQLA